MTEEQRIKAIEALIDRLPISPMRMAFDRHLKAVEWVNKYNLPYRICLDYIKNYDSANGYVCINPCYPAPGYCKDDLIHLSPDDLEIDYHLNMTPKEESTRQQIQECCDKLRPWNLAKAAGRKQWEYYFAHFLNSAQLNTYTLFDWFGEKNAPNVATKISKKNQQERIKYWLSLQKKFRQHPEDYKQEEPRLADYDLDRYTTNEFIVDWNQLNTRK